MTPEDFLRDLLILDAVGGTDGAQRLVDAARAGDRDAIAAALSGAPSYVLADAVANAAIYALTATVQAIIAASTLTLEALTDIRDHGGNLDDVVVGMRAMVASLGRAHQDSPDEHGDPDGGVA